MENRIRCFNHTIQLAAVALIKPFNAGMMKTKGDSEKDDDEDGGVVDAEEENEEEGVDDDDDNSDDEDDNTTDDTTDDIDKFQTLTEAQQDTLVKDTALIRATVTKVCICCYTISSSNIYYRFDNCPLPSSIQPRRPFLHGAVIAVRTTSRLNSFLVTLSHNGILHMTCYKLHSTTKLSLMLSQRTSH
jgi:hypothetical protein